MFGDERVWGEDTKAGKYIFVRCTKERFGNDTVPHSFFDVFLTHIPSTRITTITEHCSAPLHCMLSSVGGVPPLLRGARESDEVDCRFGRNPTGRIGWRGLLPRVRLARLHRHELHRP